jgi:hypothetical protein
MRFADLEFEPIFGKTFMATVRWGEDGKIIVWRDELGYALATYPIYWQQPTNHYPGLDPIDVQCMLDHYLGGNDEVR